MDFEITQSDETDSCIISDSHFLLCQAMNMSYSLASGLNLFLLVDTIFNQYNSYNIHLHVVILHTSFVNNKGHYGNFLFVLYASLSNTDVGIIIKNLSVVSNSNFPGLVIYYMTMVLMHMEGLLYT